MHLKKTLIVAALCVGLSPMLKAEVETATTNAVPPANLTMEASVLSGEVIGAEQVRRVHLARGKHELQFVLPRGQTLNVSTSSPEKLIISALDASYYITLRFSADGGKSLKERVQAEFAGCYDITETAYSADGETGPAVEGTWDVGVAVGRKFRVACIPTFAGTLEITVIGDPQASASAQETLTFLLATLTSNRHGKIETLAMDSDT
jgi:hypothetical protein